MTDLTVRDILDDLKFAAEAGSEYDYDLDETDAERPFIVVTEFGADGAEVGKHRMRVEFEPILPVSEVTEEHPK